MKANELMLGDWVYGLYPDGSRYNSPFRISAVDTYPSNKSPRIVTEGGYGFQEEHLAPIPLTPEILEKNGVALVEVGDHGVATPAQNRDRFEKWLLKTTWKDVVLWFDRFTSYYNVASMEGARIHYVHELQHVLRLCGIEKEVEL